MNSSIVNEQMKHDCSVFAALILSAGISIAFGNTVGAAGAADTSSRPNILWIVADDLSCELGCYGYQYVQTPNIDGLAQQGEVYTRAFATAPVCSSSRSALITGVYQTTSGTHPHRVIYSRPLPAPIEPITKLLRDAGYFVSISNSTMTRRGKTDYNFQYDASMYDGVDWTNRDQGQPFFAQVQIKEPHRRFVSASKDRDVPQDAIPSYYPNHELIRADWADYLASIAVLDQRVGEVLKRLDREGLTDNTLVFFFGDHGRPHYRDKQWLYDGGIQTPLIVRWPDRIEPATQDKMVSLIDVAAATVAAAEVGIPDWMQGHDLLANENTGRSHIYAARDRCGSTLDRIRCVRTPRYKYIRNFFPDRPYSQHSGYKELSYPGMTVARVLNARGQLSEAAATFWRDKRPAEELYDLENDPEELTNLAEAPDFQSVLRDLRDNLDNWMMETGDRGGESEPEMDRTVRESNKWYEKTIRKRGLPPYPDPEVYLHWWTTQLAR